MTVALALKPQTIADKPLSVGSNLPKMSDITAVFSHVGQNGDMVTKSGDHHTTSGYRVVAVETGTIEKARELAERHRLRHCFNEESIIRHLEESKQPFNIVEVVVDGLGKDYVEAANAKAKDTSFMSSYILTPRNPLS